jgi:hypothetical protein
MWRAFFLSAGIFLILLGAQCLGVQKFVLKARQPVVERAERFLFSAQQAQAGPQREVVPPPWAPWSLMATGAVVCLYSFSIPARLNS